jgi:hypothetical protein
MSTFTREMNHIHRLYDMAEKTAGRYGRARRKVWKHLVWLAQNEYNYTLRSRIK